MLHALVVYSLISALIIKQTKAQRKQPHAEPGTGNRLAEEISAGRGKDKPGIEGTGNHSLMKRYPSEKLIDAYVKNNPLVKEIFRAGLRTNRRIWMSYEQIKGGKYAPLFQKAYRKIYGAIWRM